jgi:5-methylcytosine-specific restriction endonuclease McrA
MTIEEVFYIQMKICWNNLEDLIYNKKTGRWYKKDKKGVIRCYICKDNCKCCNEPFLTMNKNANYCCCGCSRKGKHLKESSKNKIREYFRINGHPWSGRKHSDLSKKKMSYSQKNKAPAKLETRKKISEFQKGRKLTEEVKNNISKGKMGDKNPNWKGGVKKRGVPLYDTYAPQLEWCEEVRRKADNPNVLEVKCTYCGRWFMPKLISVRNRLQILKDSNNYHGEHRFYCSEHCKQACPIYNKSPETLMKEDAVRAGRLGWLELNREVQPELRQTVLKRDDYICVKCGSKGPLHCHHVLPVVDEPLLSADIDNCITLCEQCHKEVHKQDGCRYGQLRMEIC